MRAATPHILNDLPNHEINIPPCQSHGRDGWNGMAPYCNRQIWNAFSTLSSSFIPFLFSFHFFVIGVMPFKRLSLSAELFFFVLCFLRSCSFYKIVSVGIPRLIELFIEVWIFLPHVCEKSRSLVYLGPVRECVCVFFSSPNPLNSKAVGSSVA